MKNNGETEILFFYTKGARYSDIQSAIMSDLEKQYKVTSYNTNTEEGYYAAGNANVNITPSVVVRYIYNASENIKGWIDKIFVGVTEKEKIIKYIEGNNDKS